MHVQGTCHCGQVKLTAIVDPERIFICHCTDCQVLTGSAFRIVAVCVPGSLSVSGPIKSYGRRADSGRIRVQFFCPDCATPLYAGSQDESGLATLRVGCLQQRQELKPKVQLWQRSALNWLPELANIPSCAEQELLG